MDSFTRRQALTLGTATALVAACAPTEPRPNEPDNPAKPGLLFADTAAGLALIDLATQRVSATYPRAVPGARWQQLFQLRGGTLQSRQAHGGKLLGTTRVGGQVIKAVSPTGRLVAVGPPRGRRDHTTITISAPGGSNTVRLAGNVEPEAFSVDDQVMYVLDYRGPDRYRVRMYDLATKQLSPLLTRDKRLIPLGKEEEMHARGRQAVLDPDGGVLYTLYTHQDDHLHTRDLLAGRDLNPDAHAFVHVLNLAQRWAYCLDLPQPFGTGPNQSHTVALDAAGKRLYVYDASSGRLVQASTEDLSITRSAFAAKGAGEAYSVTGPQRLYLAAGNRVQVADADTLTPLAAWDLPGQARGLAWLDGELLAGSGEQVLRLHARTGSRLGAIALPGLLAVRHAVATPA